MKIEFVVVMQYGKLVCKPANPQAELLAKIAGTKILTHATMCLAERMGMELVELVPPAGWQNAQR